MHLTGPETVVVPVNPTIIVPITCPSFIPMAFKSMLIHSKDPQSRAIVKDPANPLDGYKKRKTLTTSNTSRHCRVFVHAFGTISPVRDTKYEEALEFPLRERPNTAEPELNATWKRRKNEHEQPQFACVLC